MPRVGSRATRVQRVCGACGPVLGAGSGADTRRTVTGRSTGSGLLDTQHTAHTGQLTRWRYVVEFSGTDAGEESGAQGQGHRTHVLTSRPAPGAVARAAPGHFGPAAWHTPGHRSAGRALKLHPRSTNNWPRGCDPAAFTHGPASVWLTCWRAVPIGAATATARNVQNTLASRPYGKAGTVAVRSAKRTATL